MHARQNVVLLDNPAYSDVAGRTGCGPVRPNAGLGT
jgi:hypothetical protein